VSQGPCGSEEHRFTESRAVTDGGVVRRRARPVLSEVVDVAQVDTDHEVIVVRTPVGPAEIRATPGGELDSVCFVDVVDVLRGREAASDVNVVVMAPE
jgi:hypothetical protein